MVAIIDYGVGNLFSLRCSFDAIGEEAVVTADPAVIASADRIVLPGVGAFGDAAARLKETGLGDIVIREAKQGKPLLGICLGMQLLLDRSLEFGEHAGLGLIPGTVRPIADVIAKDAKIPHIGWNALSFPKVHPLLKHTPEGEQVYFVHSYYAADCDDSVIARTEYGGAMLTAAVARGSVTGCQFHPEKSGEVGLRILKAFCEMEAASC